MPLPNEGMSIGIRPKEEKSISTDHFGAEGADTPFSIENWNGRSCPAPEELSEHSDGLACEADEGHLPRAAQLALVPELRATDDLARLPPVSQLEPRAILPVSVVAKIDHFATRVYVPEPQELAIAVSTASKKGQRSISLVATVFTASAFCIWTIGSSPSPDLTYEPQVASSAANLIAPFPPSSSGQASMLTPTQAFSGQSGQFLQQLVASAQPQSSSETKSRTIEESRANIVPSVLKGTPSPNGLEDKILSQEPQSGASSENAEISRSVEGVQPRAPSGGQDLLATPQASAAPNQISSPKVATRRLEPEEIKLFVTRGEQLMGTGDIAAARIVLQRAAESDDATAALALGAAHDPNVLARLGVVGISADLEKARTWYQKAESLGSADARRRLGLLDR